LLQLKIPLKPCCEVLVIVVLSCSFAQKWYNKARYLEKRE